MARFLLFTASLILAIASSSTAAILPRDVSCDKNPVIKVLSLLKASSFCSSYINLATKTVSVTTTHATTLVVPSTSTAVLQVPLTSTERATITFTTVLYTGAPGATVTVPLTQTITPPVVTSIVTTPTTVTTIQTTTFFPGGPALVKRKVGLEGRALELPPQLSSYAASVVSSACSCYVPTPITTTTATVLATSISTSITIVSSTNSYYEATTTLSEYTTVTVDSTTTSLDATATSTATVTAAAVTTISTVTSTKTVTSISTVTDSTPSFTPVLGPENSTRFIGFNSQSISIKTIRLPDSTALNAAYQTCVAACVATRSSCKSFEILLQPGFGMYCMVFNLPIGSYSAGDQIYVVDWQDIGSTKVAAYNVIQL